MSIEQNKALAKLWGDEIWGKGNLAVVDEIFAPNFVFHYPGVEVTPNREGYKKIVAEWRTPLADIEGTTEDMIAEGDKVVVRWTWSGIHKGDYMGIAPTGKQMTLTGICILRIAGGKIVEEWGEMNILGVMQQLGAFPPQK